ncbi:hypothetical protein E1B28_013752 [Marasmius oreades]|uniref:TPX2 C-terminal domain-containing protein n=1 Tax=Marasmius oreades TaxID=181124 RepID=A0A9P7UML1_9AGAR|nr:uncharacterized protein E1B28_013752 [Marasmius oreades]KAG7087812.1 hypothetical protein E1B28_013752 [Marasmius oreades]
MRNGNKGEDLSLLRHIPDISLSLSNVSSTFGSEGGIEPSFQIPSRYQNDDDEDLLLLDNGGDFFRGADGEEYSLLHATPAPPRQRFKQHLTPKTKTKTNHSYTDTDTHASASASATVLVDSPRKNISPLPGGQDGEKKNKRKLVAADDTTYSTPKRLATLKSDLGSFSSDLERTEMEIEMTMRSRTRTRMRVVETETGPQNYTTGSSPPEPLPTETSTPEVKVVETVEDIVVEKEPQEAGMKTTSESTVDSTTTMSSCLDGVAGRLMIYSRELKSHSSQPKGMTKPSTEAKNPRQKDQDQNDGKFPNPKGTKNVQHEPELELQRQPQSSTALKTMRRPPTSVLKPSVALTRATAINNNTRPTTNISRANTTSVARPIIASAAITDGSTTSPSDSPQTGEANLSGGHLEAPSSSWSLPSTTLPSPPTHSPSRTDSNPYSSSPAPNDSTSAPAMAVDVSNNESQEGESSLTASQPQPQPETSVSSFKSNSREYTTMHPQGPSEDKTRTKEPRGLRREVREDRDGGGERAGLVKGKETGREKGEKQRGREQQQQRPVVKNPHARVQVLPANIAKRAIPTEKQKPLEGLGSKNDIKKKQPSSSLSLDAKPSGTGTALVSSSSTSTSTSLATTTDLDANLGILDTPEPSPIAGDGVKSTSTSGAGATSVACVSSSNTDTQVSHHSLNGPVEGDENPLTVSQLQPSPGKRSSSPSPSTSGSHLHDVHPSGRTEGRVQGQGNANSRSVASSSCSSSVGKKRGSLGGGEEGPRKKPRTRLVVGRGCAPPPPPHAHTRITRRVSAVRARGPEKPKQKGVVGPVKAGPKVSSKPEWDDEKNNATSVNSSSGSGSGSAKPNTNTKPFEFRFRTDMRVAERQRQQQRSISSSASASASAGSSVNAKVPSGFSSSVHPIPDFKSSHAQLDSALALRRSQVTPVIPISMGMHTEVRAQQRAEFDLVLREKERQREEMEEARRKEEREEEEREVREIRRRIDEVNKARARPVPEWYYQEGERGKEK